MYQLTPLAKELRKNQTDVEGILWAHIRKRQLSGVHFRRQMPIGKYIVDFVSRKDKLITELDGGQHNEEEAQGYDGQRTACFERLGWNNEIRENLPGVMEKLYIILESSPLPNPLRPEREEKGI